MLKDEKWIEYAVKILKSVDNGSNSISHIASDIGGSESYIAKVVASLRRAGYISNKYELRKGLNEITVKEIVKINSAHIPSSMLIDHMMDKIYEALDFPVKDLFDK